MVREFSDYVQPNMALANGSIDANLFQHTLYFDKFTADKGLKLSKLIVVPTAGMGFYSRKINSLDALKKGDIITLSNDPTNLARGLRFLQSLGLITIKDNIDPTKASERDIASNPKDWFSTAGSRTATAQAGWRDRRAGYGLCGGGRTRSLQRD